MGKLGGKREGSGRKRGVPNRATREIRLLIQQRVDWEGIIDALERRAKKKSDLAARLLLEYGYGKPAEMGNQTGLSGTELVAALKGLAQAFMANTGESLEPSDNREGAE